MLYHSTTTADHDRNAEIVQVVHNLLMALKDIDLISNTYVNYRCVWLSISDFNCVLCGIILVTFV